MNITNAPFCARNATIQENNSRHQSNNFKNQIKEMVNTLEANSNKLLPLLAICPIIQATRRRLYDVFNVFAAIGCLTRSQNINIIWHGRKQIIIKLKSLKTDYKIDDWSLSLNELFPAYNYVSLESLTIAFLLLFPALDTNIIDLRTACLFFSRKTTRYKTTLCQLYQIILILSALDIVTRTDIVCQIQLLSPYHECLLGEKKIEGPESIEYLLNRINDEKDECIRTRRDEFLNSFIWDIKVPKNSKHLVR